MDVVVVVLRLLHIFGGIFWVGASLMTIGFLNPAIRASGPAGGQVMGRLMTGTRLSMMMGLAGGVTVLADILLYLRDSGGLQLAWITSASGLALTIGGLAGTAAAGVGGSVTGRTAKKIGQLNASVQGAPSEGQLIELRKLQRTLQQAQRWTVGLMIVAVIGMSVARYL